MRYDPAKWKTSTPTVKRPTPLRPLCHTGLISHRLGEDLHDGEVRERIEGDSLLSERYAAMQDHLAKNEINLDKESITLGPSLKFNPRD